MDVTVYKTVKLSSNGDNSLQAEIVTFYRPQIKFKAMIGKFSEVQYNMS